MDMYRSQQLLFLKNDEPKMKRTKTNTWLSMIVWTSASAVVCLSGCASVSNSLLGPAKSDSLQTEFTSPIASTAQRAQPNHSVEIQHESSQTRPSDRAVVPASYTANATVTASAPSNVGEPLVQTADVVYPHVAQGMGASCGSGSLTFVQDCEEACSPSGIRLLNAQEHLYDGGDTQSRATVLKDWSAVGIEPTDTVAYYETVNGTVCVTPTNRVPIYAPRFGAVRQVTGALLANRAVGTERILAPVSAARVDENMLAGTMVQPLSPQGERQVSLIDAFMDNTGGVRLETALPPQRLSEAMPTHEGVDVATTGRIFLDQPPVTGLVLQNSPTLYIIESLAVEVDGVKAAVLTDRKKAQEVVLYEIPDKCSLRICKTASHTIANSGDTIRFTLRFDNAGVKPIGNLVLTDNLTPRLEYVEGSQQSSVDVRFSMEPNTVGSHVLRWEIVEPLDKLEGGVITFDCHVR